ncbi:very short patch repair endonuclease [Chryseobacterium contaminans]|uniref:very short patch repair endonuclease n=1 Tax=Chryseobacterium contaminans TaxID=1423959 RepID=UPI00301ACC71
MDNLTKEQRRKNMQAIKSVGSKAEVILAKALFAKGYRYRKNNNSVFGKPDLTFKKIKLAIFVDGEFWHGKDWEIRKNNLKTNQEYWIPKIERNMQRDNEVNLKLSEQGWRILRFWSKEVEKNFDTCISQIEYEINKLKTNK